MKKKINEVNYFELTPLRLLAHEIDEESCVRVLIPRFTNKFLVRFLTPHLKDPYVRVNFDELGSETWTLIDGEKKVEAICAALSEKVGEKAHPVEERVTKFLSQLYRYKFISFKELSKGNRNG